MELTDGKNCWLGLGSLKGLGIALGSSLRQMADTR
jgi:hypothetical protein